MPKIAKNPNFGSKVGRKNFIAFLAHYFFRSREKRSKKLSAPSAPVGFAKNRVRTPTLVWTWGVIGDEHEACAVRGPHSPFTPLARRRTWGERGGGGGVKFSRGPVARETEHCSVGAQCSQGLLGLLGELGLLAHH